MTDLTDRHAIVTGASGGIGSEIARAFARAGADVLVHYHSDAEAAEHVADDIRSEGRDAATVQADLSDPASAALLFDRAVEAFGSVEILINNAGLSLPVTLADYDDESVATVLMVNLQAPIRLLAQAESRLADGGRVINIGSSLSDFPIEGSIAYAASKAALKAATEVAAIELGPRQITVNTLQPGVTVPGMSTHAPDLIKERAAADSPLGRNGHPRDIAGVVVFLASEPARWVTGQHLLVNGGGTI